MRNLIEYPVDRTEVVIVLDTLIASISREMLVGDVRPMILASLRLLVADKFNEPDIKKYFEIPAA